MKLPLEGVKVVELGTHVVVPTVSRVMADWGAQVIKVESPSGDLWRIVGLQYASPVSDEENPLFAAQNANKEFISVNLKTPQGMAVLRRLLEDADIFLSNVRMNSLQKMGLDYEGVKAVNEGIIYTHFSGYGDRGPEAAKPGFDLSTYWARSGTMCEWVNTGDFPFRPPGGYGDAVASSALMNGVLAALFARERTGKGTCVTSSLLGAALWFNQVGIISAEPHHGNQYPKSKLRPANPFSHIYQCRDGEWLIITVSVYATDYPKCCRLLGLDEYVDDPRYNSLDAVAEHIEEFVGIINQKFLQKDRAEWQRLFSEADIVNEALVHTKDVTLDRQAWENGYFRSVSYPGSGHVTAFPTAPVQLRDYPVERFELPEGIGRDSRAILLRHGYAESEIDAMLAQGAVKETPPATTQDKE